MKSLYITREASSSTSCRTGVPIINAVAPAPEQEGSDRLIIYSKVPLYDRKHRIIGIADFTERWKTGARHQSFTADWPRQFSICIPITASG